MVTDMRQESTQTLGTHMQAEGAGTNRGEDYGSSRVALIDEIGVQPPFRIDTSLVPV